jgi:signal transduction histidine kinase
VVLTRPDGTVYNIDERPPQRALRGEVVTGEEIVIKMEGVADISVLTSSQPIFDKEGRIAGTITVFQDMNKIKETERAKARFLSMIAHELRTPLASIKGTASSLLSDVVEWDEATHRQFLQTIDNEADRLTDMITNFLDMARLEAGFLQLDFEEVYLADIADEISERLTPLADQFGQTIRINLPVDIPPVIADYNQLLRVFINLVGNALKYSPVESLVEVDAQVISKEALQAHLPDTPLKTDSSEQFVLVTVSDEGHGIPPEEREKVFEQFYRSKASRSQKGARKAGTGLGLAICREVLALHHGRIWYEERSGGGSLFRFYLPL